MKVKDAKKITGSMTKTKKMPGLSYSLPAWACIVGKKLRKVKNSVCAGCYALKGNYTRYPNIKAAQYYRLATLMKPQWVPAMVTQVKRQRWFRWHDAGDLQSVEHLKRIFEVCSKTPATRHWLPTREAKFLKLMDPDVIPKNLIIRMSSHMIDQEPVKFWPWTSTVVSHKFFWKLELWFNKLFRIKGKCFAPIQGNTCRSCRQCWDRTVINVSYYKH
jgi:hypothetical protein